MAESRSQEVAGNVQSPILVVTVSILGRDEVKPSVGISESRPEMLLNILLSTGQLITSNYQLQS